MRFARPLTTLAAALLGALALLALPAFAAAKDGNHDRIPDRWEHRHHLSTSVNQARRDQDHDHLRNRAEFLAGDNPRQADSDGDGIPDGEENAGKIASFDAASDRLTIDLFDGETISGLVDEGTEIKCEHEHADDSIAMRHGESEPGDDRGGPGEEGGDDNGVHGGDEASCTTADLVAGATVQEAELRLGGGTATFEEVELAG
jgi:hypothetical protein